MCDTNWARSTTPKPSAAVTRIVGEAPLVLADGHHRFETALNYRAEHRAEGIDDPGAGAIMCFVVELVDDELWIEPIHRLVDLPAGVDLRAALADAFTITDAGPLTPENVDALTDRMRGEGGLGLADARGLALAIPRPEVRAAALAGEHPAVAATDAAFGRSPRRPPTPRRVLALPPRRGRNRSRGRQGQRECRDPLLAGDRGPDPGRGGRPGPHAAEDDVLQSEAAHRHGVPHARLNARPMRRSA